MQAQQFVFHQNRWLSPLPEKPQPETQLPLCFGRPDHLFDTTAAEQLRTCFPGAHLVGCSTAGEIAETSVLDDSLVVTALTFSRTCLDFQCCRVRDPADSRAAGQALAQRMRKPLLRHLLVFSEGLQVNGSELVQGLQDALPEGVMATGGLAGDYSHFQSTSAWLDTPPEAGQIVAVGFYGEAIRIGHGSLGGWDPFGPDRRVTRSEGHVLFELDGKSALDLYKSYLGDYAADLPASGLLFPLELRVPGHDQGLVRTLLAVNEADHSMTFAGDLPEGATVRLMKANVDRLVEGAEGAAEQSRVPIEGTSACFALLISCVGRRMVMQQRVEEELEAVRDILGASTCLAGFYSYGEISPLHDRPECALHNQTMTITTLSEGSGE